VNQFLKELVSRLALSHNLKSGTWTPFVALLAVLTVATPSLAERPVTSLDGAWSFRLDPQDTGRGKQWFGASVRFTNTVQVPDAWQAQGYGAESEKLWHHFGNELRFGVGQRLDGLLEAVQPGDLARGDFERAAAAAFAHEVQGGEGGGFASRVKVGTLDDGSTA
jgi:hypothetical protein